MGCDCYRHWHSRTRVCECCTRVYKSSREFACVFGLSELQFSGFQGWAVIAAAKGLVGRVFASDGREFASGVREFTRVHESLPVFWDCLNRQFSGFQGWAVIAAVRGVVGRVFASDGREFTRVYESLTVFWGCLNCSSRDFRDGL